MTASDAIRVAQTPASFPGGEGVLPTSAPPPLFQKFSDGHVVLNLHPGQRRAWDAPERFVAVIAGHQGGKTEFGAHWLAREIKRTAINAPNGADYYAVTATYDLFKLKMLPSLQAILTPDIGWNYHAGDQTMEHKGSKTRIILRSAASPGGLEAGTGRAAWLDECGQDAFTMEAWEAVQRRLAIHKGRVLFTTTPYNFGWLKTDVHDKAVAGIRNYVVVQFRSCDNPAYSMEEYERQRSLLPSWKFEMTCNGIFTLPAGTIYSDFRATLCPALREGPIDFERYNPSKHGHLIRDFTPPPSWPRLVGVDFGGSENLAILWLAEDTSRGIYYAYRETMGGGMSGQEHARAALSYTRPNPDTGIPQETVRVWTGGAKAEGDARLQWNMAGIPVILPFITDVEAGIDHVISLIRQNRLFVMESLNGLRQELATYARELDKAGHPTMKIDDKGRFHRLDALRGIASAIPMDGPGPAEEKSPLIDFAASPRSAAMDYLEDVEDGRVPNTGQPERPDKAWIEPRWREYMR